MRCVGWGSSIQSYEAGCGMVEVAGQMRKKQKEAVFGWKMLRMLEC